MERHARSSSTRRTGRRPLMDVARGARAAIAPRPSVRRPRGRMEEPIAPVDRIGEWLPGARGGSSWEDGVLGSFAASPVHCPQPVFQRSGRYGEPRRGGGRGAKHPRLDGSRRSRLIGSAWRRERREGGESPSTRGLRSSTHGTCDTGAHAGSEADPRNFGLRTRHAVPEHDHHDRRDDRRRNHEGIKR